VAHRRGAGGAAYYRAENLAGLEAQTQTSPGQFPFARGSGKPWEAADAVPTGANVIRADELGRPAATPSNNSATRWPLASSASLRWPQPAWWMKPRVDRIRFLVGSTYFLEIAKLRAARLIWAQAVAAFGPADPHAPWHVSMRAPRAWTRACMTATPTCCA